MFLRSLTLKGFKSFAEATVLDFEPGVTVVVGPNGSGKSNIVDAVAWVLGAQSPSALRSARMDDVIFAGNANRTALGRAEVSLTIDNSAGLLPIGLAEVTITRTLFRSSGESDYALNGAPCRLLDIQELLSDSGVGRTQHVIVSQGNLDSVLNARPEERRTVIEEAAGVLKYRRRKQKAERRLDATEANLVRLQDLLREVRRQLRPLERQADAARRHGDVAAELRALRLYLSGRELASLAARRNAAAADAERYGAELASLRGTLHGLDADVAAAEAAVARMGGAELGAITGRFEALRERARGVAAVVAERARSLQRERAAFTDESLVAALEAEGARLVGELAEVERRVVAVAAEAEPLRTEADAVIAARAELPPTEAGSGPRRAAELRGERAALEAGLERDRYELGRLATRLSDIEGAAADLDGQAAAVAAELAELDAATPALAEAASAAERAVAGAASARDDAATRKAEAELEQHTWQVRADALSTVLSAAGGANAAEALSSVDGVVGVLGDLVRVDPGYEAAFRAAVGDAVAASVARDAAVARRALAVLRAAGAAATVISPSPRAAVGAPRGNLLRDHVDAADPIVRRVLDALLAPVLVAPSLTEAVAIASANPDSVVVTRDGDRLGRTGWRTGGGRGPARASEEALAEARARAEEHGHAASSLASVLRAANDALAVAEAEHRDAVAAVDAHRRRRDERDGAWRDLAARQAARSAELDAARAHGAELARRVEAAEARRDELAEVLAALEAEEAAGASRRAEAERERRRLDERAAALATLQTEAAVQVAALEERRASLIRRRAEIDERLSRHAAERDEAASRRLELDRRAERLAALAAFVAGRLAVIDGAAARAGERRRKESEAVRDATARLEGLRASRVTADRRMEEVRELVRRAELEDAEARLRHEAAVETLRHDLDCEPTAALAAICPELPAGTSPEERARELERDLRMMGPINPLALQEFSALSERSAFLEEQLADVKATRRELGKVIHAIDAEIVQVFAAAYADVAENFSSLFETLFPGGHARLRLTDPDNLLDTGIEIEARPSGKNVRKLSLLSGGERSLTALAFLFAVFRSRPSPFYILDEVEAALDDVNLHRFLDLIAEFRDEAQLLIVSHQKRTMEAADCLYGVTMAPGRSSFVVSERVSAPA